MCDRACGGGGASRRCCAPPEVPRRKLRVARRIPSLGRHFSSISVSQSMGRLKYPLSAEHMQARVKRRKPPKNCRFPKNKRINALIRRFFGNRQFFGVLQRLPALANARQTAGKSGVSNTGARKQRGEGRPRDGICTSDGARQLRSPSAAVRPPCVVHVMCGVYVV